MPLYDCMLLAKPHVRKEDVADLVARVGRRVLQRNGVVTDVKSFGSVKLGYGIKKRDGRHWQGQMMQLTFMVPPAFASELHYLNKEDRLLRWLVVKHRAAVYGAEHVGEEAGREEMEALQGDLMGGVREGESEGESEGSGEEEEEEVDVLEEEEEDEEE